MDEVTGIVDKYNGYTGKIKSNDLDYLLIDKNIMYNEIIKESDEVSFIPEKENNINIARFVKKRNKYN